MRIAYQGEPGAFSEAASQKVTPDAEPVPCKAFEDVFAAVASGACALGVLPIENSIGGSIHRNFDLLLQNDLTIVGEVEVPVVHHLLALPETKLESIRRVYSHPQALAQCDRFLRTLKNVEVIATYDTAGSAKLVADGKMTDAAAIASARAAAVFGLKSLKSGIQDFDHNVTRFLVVEKPSHEVRLNPDGDTVRLKPDTTGAADKTTIVFTLRNEPGALFKALAVFALRGIDLTKLESRPFPEQKWEYLFYVDLAASSHDENCQRALAHLAEFAPMLRVLGTYPSLKKSTTATFSDAVRLKPDTTGRTGTLA